MIVSASLSVSIDSHRSDLVMSLKSPKPLGMFGGAQKDYLVKP